MRILVIEDHEDSRNAFKDFLDDAGYAVIVAGSVDEALRLMEGDWFALVLTDYLLASRADAEREAARLVDAAGPIPVGCISAWPTIPEALGGRFAFVLPKPFAGDQLLAQVAATLSSPPTQTAVRIVHRYFAALGERAWDDLAALCTDDVRYHLPGGDPQLCREVVGRTAFREYTGTTFREFPAATFEVIDVAGLPRGVVARYRGRWRGADGQPACVDGAVAFGIRGDRIAEIGVRLDLAKVRGFTPAASGRDDGATARLRS